MNEPVRPDYRALRLHNLTDPDYRHILLLLYWPVHGLIFFLLERGGFARQYYTVECALDRIIPFNEWFFIPYFFWFVYLIGGLCFTFFYDVRSFRRMMYFIILTYGATLVIYILWPTQQLLRPDAFARDNILTRLAAWVYQFDTNTNVCPSMHVLGSMAVSFGMWDCGHFQKPVWRTVFGVLSALISVSTLFVKQHSIIDVIAATVLGVLALLLISAFTRRRVPRREKPEAAQS